MKKMKANRDISRYGVSVYVREHIRLDRGRKGMELKTDIFGVDKERYTEVCLW